ncbi:MAG: hypothetical protein ACYDH6_08950 [Acidimicrobiales bacterium]
MRRLICRVLAGLCLSAAAIPALGLIEAPGAAAASVSTVAYWVKGGVALPTVPSGGMLVGDDPSAAVNPNQPPPLPAALPVAPPHVSTPGPQLNGYTAVSALRITGVPLNADITMTLPTAPGSVPPLPGVSTIIACPIDPSWRPPAGGAGDVAAAPPGNCNSPSVGRVASDFMSVSWLLPATYQQNPGEIDIEVQPGVASVPGPFLVAFARPLSSAFHASAGGPLPTTPPVVAPEAPAGGQVPVPAAGPVPQPVQSFPSLAAPISPQSVTAPAPPALPSVSRLAGVTLPGVGDDRAHRIMAVVILFMIAAGWWWVGGRANRAPRRLGALSSDSHADAEQLGGIGRFRRARGVRPKRI